MMTLLTFLVYIVGLFGTIVVVIGLPVYLAITGREYWRTNKWTPGFAVGLAMLTGYVGGGEIVWHLVPPDWNLSFLTTFEAAGNAAKYGHPVEHYAESILVAMMAAAVGGATIMGLLTGAAGVLLRRRAAHRPA